jgi:hypothetical protein
MMEADRGVARDSRHYIFHVCRGPFRLQFRYLEIVMQGLSWVTVVNCTEYSNHVGPVAQSGQSEDTLGNGLLC